MTALGSTKTFASSSNGCKCYAANASVAWIGCSWPWLPGTITANIRRYARKEKPKGKSRRQGGKAAVSSGSGAQAGLLRTVAYRPSARARVWQHIRDREIRQRQSPHPPPLSLSLSQGKLVFKKILVANRGEIAIRVARTCRELGIATVAVYSAADLSSPHLSAANEAVCIGPAQASASYLNTEAILLAARRTGAEAVHPGYGFLSENATFARCVRDAGLTFIGPAPEALAAVGNKIVARQTVAKLGVPVIVALEQPSPDPTVLREQVRALGYPLLIKAAAGGGGKGMRIVRHEKELAEAVAAAEREATAAFAEGTVYLVREQIRIAAGERLGWSQDEVRGQGHACECRVYAEDPARGFFPSPGKVLAWNAPSGPGVRVDAGVELHTEVSMYYDPLIAKVSTWGPLREQSRRRMSVALRQCVVLGPT